MMRILLAVAAILAVTPAVAREARGIDRAVHLGHHGLGRPLTAAQAAALPKSWAVASHHSGKQHVTNARASAERAGYKRVSDLTKGAFPTFYPGLGAVFVKPTTLPVGPFLSFDRKDRLVATTYMLSLEEMNAHKKFDASGTRQPRVDHITVYHHAGHPGVDFPHYHYVLWHVSKKGEARVAK